MPAVTTAPPVRLSVPAESRYVRLVRLTAAAIADDAGLDIDGVEDLRIAVNELFALLVDGAEEPTTVIELSFANDGTAVTVSGHRPGGGPIDGPEDLALEILRVVVDEHAFDHDDGDRRFTLRKRLVAR